MDAWSAKLSDRTACLVVRCIDMLSLLTQAVPMTMPTWKFSDAFSTNSRSTITSCKRSFDRAPFQRCNTHRSGATCASLGQAGDKKVQLTPFHMSARMYLGNSRVEGTVAGRIEICDLSPRHGASRLVVLFGLVWGPGPRNAA